MYGHWCLEIADASMCQASATMGRRDCREYGRAAGQVLIEGTSTLPFPASNVRWSPRWSFAGLGCDGADSCLRASVCVLSVRSTM